MGVFPASSPTVAVLDGAPSTPPLSSEPVAIVDLGSNSARVVVVDHPIPGVLETIAEERLDLRLATELDERSQLSGAWHRHHHRRDRRVRRLGARGRRRLHQRRRHRRHPLGPQPRRAACPRTRRAGSRHRSAGRRRGGAVRRRRRSPRAPHSLRHCCRYRRRQYRGRPRHRRHDRRRLELPARRAQRQRRLAHDDPPTRKQLKSMRRMVAETLASSAPSGLDAGEELIATGGSARALARLAQRQGSYPFPRLHGYSMDRETVREMGAFLAGHSLVERCEIDGVRAGRADSIVGGAIILDEMMRHLRADQLTVARRWRARGRGDARLRRTRTPAPARARRFDRGPAAPLRRLGRQRDGSARQPRRPAPP